MSRGTQKKLFNCEQDNKAETSTNSCPTNKLYYERKEKLNAYKIAYGGVFLLVPRPTRVVPDQRPLNGCVRVCVCVCLPLLACWLVKWRVAYLLSVAMAVEDDSCASLIDAVKFVFEACGVEFYRPPQEHFMSMNDFANHADEIWEELPTRARSEHAPPSSFSLLSLSSYRVASSSSRRRRRVVVVSSSCRPCIVIFVVVSCRVVASSSLSSSSRRRCVASSLRHHRRRRRVVAFLRVWRRYIRLLTYLLTYLRIYYPRDATLAAALCPSVCPTQVDVLSRRLGGLSWFLARRLPSTYPTL